MKTEDKMLLHSLDAVTPGGLKTHHHNVVVSIIRACTYFACFLAGFLVANIFGG